MEVGYCPLSLCGRCLLILSRIAFCKGRNIAVYSTTSQTLVVHHFVSPRGPAISSPSVPLKLDAVPLLFALPSTASHTPLLCITTTALHRYHFRLHPTPTLELYSVTTLPLPKPPAFVLPVDPMAWSRSRHDSDQTADGTSTTRQHDALVSLSEEGELAFWIPLEGTDGVQDAKVGWSCTGTIRTQRKGISLARCSSAKKTAIGGVLAVVLDGLKLSLRIL